MALAVHPADLAPTAVTDHAGQVAGLLHRKGSGTGPRAHPYASPPHSAPVQRPGAGVRPPVRRGGAQIAARSGRGAAALLQHAHHVRIAVDRALRQLKLRAFPHVGHQLSVDLAGQLRSILDPAPGERGHAAHRLGCAAWPGRRPARPTRPAAPERGARCCSAGPPSLTSPPWPSRRPRVPGSRAAYRAAPALTPALASARTPSTSAPDTASACCPSPRTC